MFNIQEEKNKEAIDECIALGEAYYNEVEQFSNNIPYNMNPEPLYTMVDAGLLHLYIARDELDRVVAFASVLVIEDFVTSTLCGRYYNIYIKPKYRKGRLFYRINDFVENKMDELGVKFLIFGLKSNDNLSLPTRLGYQHSESIFQKMIGE